MEILKEETLYRLIKEELSKSEVSSMIASKLDTSINSNDFKKKVKDIAADILENLFKVLYMRTNSWKSAIKS